MTADATTLWRLARYENGFAFKPEHFTDDGIPVIRIRQLVDASAKLDRYDGSLPERFRIRNGDLIFSWSGSLAVRRWERGDAWLNQHLFKVEPVAGVDKSWLRWVIQSSIPLFEGMMHGSAMTHLNLDMLKMVKFLRPSLDDQRRIANFLDVETTRIDQLMQLRKNQLALWQERSRAFVHQQVTASGDEQGRFVDWLGHLPVGWSSHPIGHVARFIMGTTFPHAYQGKAVGDYPFIKVSDFQGADFSGRIHEAENWITVEDAHLLGAKVVPAGAVLYARVGAALLLNRRCITTRPSIIDDNVRAIRFSHGDARYWAGVLSLLDMGQLVNPGPVPSISESQVSPVRVPDPGEEEQKKIADLIDRNRRDFESVRSLVERQVHLLGERRRTLINAAITGQFDVSTASSRAAGV